MSPAKMILFYSRLRAGTLRGFYKNEPGLFFNSPGFCNYNALFDPELQKAFSDVLAAFTEAGFLFFGEMQLEDLFHAL